MNPNHTSKEAPCVLGTVEKHPSDMARPLSAASHQTSQVGLFVSALSLVCVSRNSLIFSALAVQITIPKYKEIHDQFYPLLQWAKPINKTYMYFNLLVLCFNQTRICLFESHTYGLQSSIRLQPIQLEIIATSSH